MLSTMAEKLKGKGPIELTEGEADELRSTLRGGRGAVEHERGDGLFERETQLNSKVVELLNMSAAMAAGLKRQGFRVTHQEHSDGSVSFDLENAPKAAPMTEN